MVITSRLWIFFFFCLFLFSKVSTKEYVLPLKPNMSSYKKISRQLRSESSTSESGEAAELGRGSGSLGCFQPRFSLPSSLLQSWASEAYYYPLLAS